MKVPRFLDFAHDPVTVAKALIGQRLVRVVGGRRLAGTIVEVEAYLGAKDRAAHTYGGRRSPRNESMYLPGGHAYVYFIYGVHDCINVVCGEENEGVAVLVRALHPTEGIAAMFRNRPAARRETDLCSGPGKLTEALAIDRSLDGEDLRVSKRLLIEIARPAELPRGRLGVARRIGVDYAGHWARRNLRFYLRGDPNLSRPEPKSRW